MTMLVQYDRARAALADATRVDEVMNLRDEMEHVKLYARQINDRVLLSEAVEFQMRVERKLGTLIVAAKAAGQIAEGRRRKEDENNGTSEEPFPRVTLAEAGVSKKLSSSAQKTASISEQAFEAMVRAKREQITAGRPINLNPEVNGARAIMGSRVEPDDSLDYFPTPPWATRALIENVMPQVGRRGDICRNLAWEPAAGEGHIAEVLTEYFRDVVESDIHDYGRPDAHAVDFLSCDHVNRKDDADWIITNPPFGDKTEAFVLKALDLARVGVAMFLRLQWLETIGRYERLFKDRPPTLIAFFCERVNLCKGRWDPEGGTATAYIWLVWVKGAAPRAPFWIPPGRRESLTRADDVERFTAQPVMRKERPVDAAGAPLTHDSNTGEISDDDVAHGCTAHDASLIEAGAAAILSMASASHTPEASGTAREAPGGPLFGGPSLTRPQDSNSPGGEPAHARGEAEHSSRLVSSDGDDAPDIPDFLRRDEENVSPIMRVGGPR